MLLPADERGSRELAGPSLASSRPALVVVNARARGVSARALERAVAVLARGYRVRLARPASHAALLDTVATAGEELVVAVGGDGTVNAVVSALPPAATLAVLPIGTANDFACEVGVPRGAEAAAAQLVAQREAPARRVDLVRVNGRAFCTVGGVGLVTRTTAAAAAAREGPLIRRAVARLLGGAIYRLAAAGTMLLGRDLVTRVTVDFVDPAGQRQRWAGAVHAVFVVNHRRCGGGLALPTGSRGDDGVFELGLVIAGSRPALVANFLRLSRGAPVPAGAFTVLRATEAVLHLDEPVTFAADGELLETGQRFRLTMDPGALRIKAGTARELTGTDWS